MDAESHPTQGGLGDVMSEDAFFCPLSTQKSRGADCLARATESQRRVYRLAESELVGLAGRPLREAVVLPCGHISDLWEIQQAEKRAAGFRRRSRAHEASSPRRAAELWVSAEQSYTCAGCPASHRQTILAASADLPRAEQVNTFLEHFRLCLPSGPTAATDVQIGQLTMRLAVGGIRVPTIPWHQQIQGVLPPPPELCSAETGMLLSDPGVGPSGDLVECQDPRHRDVYPCRLTRVLTHTYRSCRGSSPERLLWALAAKFRCADSGRFLLEPSCIKESGETVDFLWRSAYASDGLTPAPDPRRNLTLKTLGQRLLANDHVCSMAAATLPPIQSPRLSYVMSLNPRDRIDFERTFTEQANAAGGILQGGDVRRANELLTELLAVHSNVPLLSAWIFSMDETFVLSTRRYLEIRAQYGSSLPIVLHMVLLAKASDHEKMGAEEFAAAMRWLTPELPTLSRELLRHPPAADVSRAWFVFLARRANNLPDGPHRRGQLASILEAGRNWPWHHYLTRSVFVRSPEFWAKPLKDQLDDARDTLEMCLALFGDTCREVASLTNLIQEIVGKLDERSKTAKSRATCSIM